MSKESCQLCGNQCQSGTIEIHHNVPTELTRPAGIPNSATTKLCGNCHREVHAWYGKNVLDVEYSARTKRFIPRSPAEMVKEYEASYRVFAEYKRGQREKA